MHSLKKLAMIRDRRGEREGWEGEERGSRCRKSYEFLHNDIYRPICISDRTEANISNIYLSSDTFISSFRRLSVLVHVAKRYNLSVFNVPRPLFSRRNICWLSMDDERRDEERGSRSRIHSFSPFERIIRETIRW